MIGSTLNAPNNNECDLKEIINVHIPRLITTNMTDVKEWIYTERVQYQSMWQHTENKLSRNETDYNQWDRFKIMNLHRIRILTSSVTSKKEWIYTERTQ